MLRFAQYSWICLLPFVAVLMLTAIPDASAVSYEKAWAICKKEVTRAYPTEHAGTNARYAYGMSCMSRYGYRLKRSARAELRRK
jgi:hypothetical protein